MQQEPIHPISYVLALARGARGRCPHCGKGKLFSKFLKVVASCDACGEEYVHHRADDMPAYLVILILGHLIVPMVVSVEMAYQPPYWLQLAIWLPLTLVLGVGLLQPVKGMVVALQWRMGLHGFHAAKARLMGNPE